MSKDQERIYVEHIAPALEWAIVEERERPDFIVREGQQQFGLELTEVFNGPSRKKGLNPEGSRSFGLVALAIDAILFGYAQSQGDQPMACGEK